MLSLLVWRLNMLSDAYLRESRACARFLVSAPLGRHSRFVDVRDGWFLAAACVSTACVHRVWTFICVL